MRRWVGLAAVVTAVAVPLGIAAASSPSPLREPPPLSAVMLRLLAARGVTATPTELGDPALVERMADRVVAGERAVPGSVPGSGQIIGASLARVAGSLPPDAAGAAGLDWVVYREDAAFYTFGDTYDIGDLVEFLDPSDLHVRGSLDFGDGVADPVWNGHEVEPVPDVPERVLQGLARSGLYVEYSEDDAVVEGPGERRRVQAHYSVDLRQLHVIALSLVDFAVRPDGTVRPAWLVAVSRVRDTCYRSELACPRHPRPGDGVDVLDPVTLKVLWSVRY